MNVKELIECINIFGVKVIFDKPEEVKDNMDNGKHVIYFTPVEGKERKRYDKSSHKEEFVSTTASIHIPDLSIEYFIDIFECDGTGLHEFTQNVIKPYCDKGVPEKIVYTSYLFLHEVGHWMQFNKLGNSVEKFINLDLDAEKDNFNKMQCLEREREERLRKGSDYILTAKERRLFRQYMQEYREIPKEKEADEFAFNKMQEILELYKKSSLSVSLQ